MAAILNVIATPIGNLGDLAPRAQTALAECDCLVAEDTRAAVRLLAAFKIDIGKMKLLSCPAPKEPDRIRDVLRVLAQGATVGLISEAGTPCVSDPGTRLVRAVVQAGYAVQVLPGPSAPLAALMGAGLNTAHFAFLGFLPRATSKRRQAIEGALQAGLALVICEAAHRVPTLLAQLYAWCGPRSVVVARELTKRFETFHRGTLGGPLEPPWREQGEAVVVVEAQTCSPATASIASAPSETELLREAQVLLAQGLSTRAVTARLRCQALHMPKRQLYQLVLRAGAA